MPKKSRSNLSHRKGDYRRKNRLQVPQNQMGKSSKNPPTRPLAKIKPKPPPDLPNREKPQTKIKPKPSLDLPKMESSSLSLRIFTAFVSGSQIGVTKADLEGYVVDELLIPKDKLPTDLLNHLHVIVIAFMNMWSGWHFKGDFLAGKFDKEHYFQRFQKYMRHKMNTVIKGHYGSAVKELLENNAKRMSEREFAPYSISISCPPGMLNTMVFSNVGDDVIMKQHLGAKWQQLTTTQLLNWPHIQVTFRTADLYIVRTQATEYTRYLNFLPNDSYPLNVNYVEHTECYGQQECYSYDFLEKYCRIYIDALTDHPQVPESVLQETNSILQQFLEDIKFINVNKSFPTNTLVLFKLSPVPFIRNKKLIRNPEVETNENRVGYCELIDPKIQVFMPYFRAKQLDSSVLGFEYTDKIKNPKESRDVVVPQISYKCTFCKMDFSGATSREDLFKHLEKDHKMEQHVRCTLCKKQFDVLALTACRWRHKCGGDSSSPGLVKQ